MSEPTDGTEERRLWYVEMAFIATAAEHEALLDRLADVLCPDPRHAGPCAVPWALHSLNEDSLSAKKRRALLREIDDTNPTLETTSGDLD